MPTPRVVIMYSQSINQQSINHVHNHFWSAISMVHAVTKQFAAGIPALNSCFLHTAQRQSLYAAFNDEC